MGKGKGRRRRQANYLAAHGGHTALPTPPSASDVAALPSKLRRIISLKASSPHGLSSLDSSKSQSKSVTKNLHGSKWTTEKQHKRCKVEKQEKTSKVQKQDDSFLKTADGGEVLQSEVSAPIQKKRKREEELEALFEKFKATPIRIGLNDRKKRYLQEKKNKKKKLVHFDSTEPNHSLHKQEKISFGDIVDAPPKLSFPKKQKNASEERLRQEAIATYRQKKNWFSRPGSHQPPPLANGNPLSF